MLELLASAYNANSLVRRVLATLATHIYFRLVPVWPIGFAAGLPVRVACSLCSTNAERSIMRMTNLRAGGPFNLFV